MIRKKIEGQIQIYSYTTVNMTLKWVHERADENLFIFMSEGCCCHYVGIVNVGHVKDFFTDRSDFRGKLFFRKHSVLLTAIVFE